MKIYQIHKYEGMYEDFRDYIVASYLDYNKAIFEKERLIKEDTKLRAKSKKCAECPYIRGCLSKTKDLKNIHSDYCNEASLEATEYGIECNNYFSYWDDATFEIVEVDVIE